MMGIETVEDSSNELEGTVEDPEGSASGNMASVIVMIGDDVAATEYDPVIKDQNDTCVGDSYAGVMQVTCSSNLGESLHSGKGHQLEDSSEDPLNNSE